MDIDRDSHTKLLYLRSQAILQHIGRTVKLPGPNHEISIASLWRVHLGVRERG